MDWLLGVGWSSWLTQLLKAMVTLIIPGRTRADISCSSTGPARSLSANTSLLGNMKPLTQFLVNCLDPISDSQTPLLSLLVSTHPSSSYTSTSDPIDGHNVSFQHCKTGCPRAKADDHLLNWKNLVFHFFLCWIWSKVSLYQILIYFAPYWG